MRVYADTSFLVKLLNQESDSQAAASLYRRLGRPPLVFLPIHHLEVTNAIRQRFFQQKHSLPSRERIILKRERDVALGRLEIFLSRRLFLPLSGDVDSAIDRARKLSEKHTERLGCRGFDLLHVASALNISAELFITADQNQGELASAEGFRVRIFRSD